NHLKYRVLNDISLESGRKVDLKYFPEEETLSNSVNRFFLTSVKFLHTGTGNSHSEYTLEYDDPNGLPPVSSYAQDYLGYFNGVTNNPSLLPRNSSELLLPYLNEMVKDEIMTSDEVEGFSTILLK